MGFFGSRDITGIDIGAGSVKFVRMSGNGKHPHLVAAGLVEISPDPAKANSANIDLAYLKSGKKFSRKNIVTLLPGRDLTIRFLMMPKIPLVELREAVRWEAKRHISYPLEAAIVEFLILGERREGMTEKYEVLLVVVERGTVIEHLRPFHEAGIAVSAVDANPLALRNVVRRRDAAEAGNILVVDMGAGKTEINILRSTGLRFSRCLETGGLDMTRAVADRLNIGMQDAEDVKQKVDLVTSSPGDPVADAVKEKLDGILLEIRRSVEYYKSTFRDQGAGMAVLTGGVALTTGIRDYFSQSLDMPVEKDDPFAGLACKESILREVTPLAPRFTAAVGLALRKA